uniref:Replication protein A2 n=1 Tax=Cryptosporidium parvum TaxID=5807 RepID=Q7Z0B1_CRYPV|nr:replication protein A2 [Cryptosporidium parvum]
MNFGENNKPFGGFGMDDLNESGGFMIDGNDSSMQNGNERKQSVGNEQKLAPLKVGMILRSYSNFVTLSRFQLFDKDINLFKLVGFVRNVEHDDYPQRLRFYLDDGSGLILIDWLVDNTGTKYKQDLVNSIHEGCFVKIFGELTLMVSEPSVRAFVVRPLVCTDEISLHDIDVASYIVRSMYGNTYDSGKVQLSDSNVIINKQGSMNYGGAGDSVKDSNQSIVSSMFNLSGQFGSNNNNNTNNKNEGNFNNYGGNNNFGNEQNISMNKPPIRVVSAIAPKSNQFNSGAGVQSNPLKLREIISSVLDQASNEGNPEMTIDGIFDSLLTRDVHATHDDIRNQLKNLVGEAKVYQTNPHTWRATGY